MKRHAVDRTSATFLRFLDVYKSFERDLDAIGALGPVGAKSDLFTKWRALFGVVCDLDRRYQIARRSSERKGGAR